MAKDQIIVVTQQDDPHADDVVLKLCELGHEPIRLNSEDIPLNTRIAFGLSNAAPVWDGAITLEANGRIINPDRIRSIWWRRPGDAVLPADLSAREREFAQLEIEHAFMGLWAGLDCYWISHPDRIRHARWKAGQLKRAVQLGFDVPRTLITNDPAEARDFYAACHGQMIYKVMSDPYLAARETATKHPDQPIEAIATPTTLISEETLEQLETIRLAPCLFQEYVPKQLELRVTVIGDQVFAAAIDSQAQAESRIDWRALEPEQQPWRKATLPAAIAERCLAFVRGYGLNFSAMDLILTPDGRYVFLENNPNGQFIWLEMLVPELKMTEALASCLIRGANSSSDPV